MTYHIHRVAVLGAGTMGAAIAAHLANVGIPSYLLDIVPPELTAEEKARGLTLKDAEVRNRFGREGLQRCLKARPANFSVEDGARLITIGNLEDNFEWIGQVDWVIEAVVERLDIKQKLMARVDAIRGQETIISTNTSGIPVGRIAEGRSAGFRAHFLGTHFFNPPRYLKLLEIIPTPETLPQVIDFMRRFCEEELGKGVVICKDTPNFIANRVLSIAGSMAMNYALDQGYSVEEVDAISGPAMGRPKTATFRLNDLVGIDVLAHVAENLYDAIPNDPYREELIHPKASALIRSMVERKWLGNKTEIGFYKKVEVGGKREFHALDLKTLEHRAPEEPRFASVKAGRDIEDPAERVGKLAYAEDRAGQYAWYVLSRLGVYSASVVPEISDDILSIDRACRWGFMWDLGPFETWDALGLRRSADRMKAEGVALPGWVEAMLAAGFESFYERKDGRVIGFYDPASRAYRPLPSDARVLSIADLKAQGKELRRNDSASLVDMGDGVLLLEFHSKANSLDDDIFNLAQEGLDLLQQDAWKGMVIGNEGKHFCVGANIFGIAVAAQQGEFDFIDGAIRKMQGLLQSIRFSPKPVVAAPFGMTLGGGCEVVMASPRVVASAETYIGLVEVGVGLIPAGTGSKEIVRRIISSAMQVPNSLALPALQQAFEQVGLAKVATSASEARQMRILGERDRIVMNPDHLLAEAKAEVLRMAEAGYRAPTPARLYAAGRDAYAALQVALSQMQEGRYASEHDVRIGRQLGYILCGGELSEGQWMDETYFLNLERQAFLNLCHEPKSIERIWYMLQNNKPLRN
ncbi:MAG TPA: 3-hydroxyacyl-CoA dehydrogenase/enoyl-CoA hydratase family protein [Anaerolineales bacterium]|nr:3-hydroxyacyl-CoA dehydrogenase/enoyl-CoA hydratase family protein [Anaerolineales bacterium]